MADSNTPDPTMPTDADDDAECAVLAAQAMQELGEIHAREKLLLAVASGRMPSGQPAPASLQREALTAWTALNLEMNTVRALVIEKLMRIAVDAEDPEMRAYVRDHMIERGLFTRWELNQPRDELLAMLPAKLAARGLARVGPAC